MVVSDCDFLGQRQTKHAPCILSWRVFWMTTFSRTTPQASPKLGFTPLELKLLDAAVTDKILRRRSFADYLNKLARLGGYS
jgi:hypothetical protein